MKKVISFAVATVVSLGFFASCEKDRNVEISAPSQEEQQYTAAETVDILTKALTVEDLKDLSLFLKQGNAESSIYLKIQKDETEYISGEVGLVAGECYKIVNLDLIALGQVPIVGTVDALKLAIYLVEANLCGWNDELLAMSLEKVNSAIDVDMMSLYYVEFRAAIDELTGKVSIMPFLVSNNDPATAILLEDLLNMML